MTKTLFAKVKENYKNWLVNEELEDSKEAQEQYIKEEFSYDLLTDEDEELVAKIFESDRSEYLYDEDEDAVYSTYELINMLKHDEDEYEFLTNIIFR